MVLGWVLQWVWRRNIDRGCVGVELVRTCSPVRGPAPAEDAGLDAYDDESRNTSVCSPGVVSFVARTESPSAPCAVCRLSLGSLARRPPPPRGLACENRF